MDDGEGEERIIMPPCRQVLSSCWLRCPLSLGPSSVAVGQTDGRTDRHGWAGLDLELKLRGWRSLINSLAALTALKIRGRLSGEGRVYSVYGVYSSIHSSFNQTHARSIPPMVKPSCCLDHNPSLSISSHEKKKRKKKRACHCSACISPVEPRRAASHKPAAKPLVLLAQFFFARVSAC